MDKNEPDILLYRKKFGKAARDRAGKDRPEVPADGDLGRRPNLLMSCHNCWSALAQWREDVRRNERMVYGDQFSDRVYDALKREWTTEREHLKGQGLNPSQYNIIRNVLRTIVGVWSSNKTLPSCIAQKDENQAESEVLTATLHAIYRRNELWKLDIAELVQLLVTGLAVTKNHFASRGGGRDVANDYIDPFAFFADNSMKDPRYTDCSIVGYFFDLSIDDIVGLFAKGSRRRAARIRDLYGRREERLFDMAETFTDERMERDFFVPGVEAEGLERVIEVWRRESAECYRIHDRLHGWYYADFGITEAEIGAENARRMAEQGAMGVEPEDMLLMEYEWGTDTYWKYYFLTPFGEVLDEGVTPFWHEGPPIVFELHEFFCGKIYPFVRDLIDTQKQINRLAAISELLSKFSAKSLMWLPIESIAEEQGYGLEYIQRESSRYDAVIPYKAKPGGAKPEYVNTMAQAFTPLNVVNMYLRLSEQVSGVYGALQGQQPASGTPAQMYAQQSQNSATSLNGIFEAINSFRVRRDRMNVQLVQQFYTDRQYVWDKVKGRRLLYDPARVKNLDVEIAIVENTDTPAYRLMINDLLVQLKQFDRQNLLDLRGIVEVGNFPFKDKMLDYLNKREQALAGAAGMPGVEPLPEELARGLAGYGLNVPGGVANGERMETGL